MYLGGMGFHPTEADCAVTAAITTGNIQYFRAITDPAQIKKISDQHIVRTNPGGTRTFTGDDILSCAALHRQFELCKFFLLDDNWKPHTRKFLAKSVGFIQTKTVISDFVAPLREWLSKKANQNDEDRALLGLLETTSNTLNASNERPSVATRIKGHGIL